jgi:RHS repeat-associated protein
METNRSVLEESIFGQTGVSNEVATTRFAKPAGWTGNASSSVSRVGTTSGHNIGPNTLQKVMAGDKISTTVQYYYQAAPGGNNTNFVNTVLSSLTTAITGGNAASGVVKGNAAQVSTQLSGMGGFVNAVQPNGSNPTSTTPQAFLTILFFDERFNFIAAADGGVAQQQVSSSFVPLTLTDVKVPKNGYAYIYVSNQSNSDVYFDNLVATITQGNIAEENHYYAYGLKIATLSSKKLGDVYEGKLQNNYLYQGAYAELDEDIGWTDFALRNYDAQIGRWVQQDPYQQFASPYLSMGNDPINNIDPSGGYSFGPFVSSVMNRALWAVGGAMIGGAIDAASGGNGINGALIGGAVGLGASFVNWGAAGVVLKKIAIRIGLQSASVAVNIINNGVVTQQVGKQAAMAHGPNNDLNSVDNETGKTESGWPETTYEGKFFSDQTKAYNYMWNNSFDLKTTDPKQQYRENMAYIVDGGILVLPNYKNLYNEADPKALPIREDSKRRYTHVKFNDKWYKIKGWIHTHPWTGINRLTGYDNGKGLPSADDYYTSTIRFPGLPAFVLSRDETYSFLGKFGKERPKFQLVGKTKDVLSGKQKLVQF